MKYHDNGCFYSVTVTTAEVEAFKKQWPCNGLPSRLIWFQFDKRNGDLVDMRPYNLEDRGVDGSAVLALCGDAQAYGKGKVSK